MGTGGLRGGGAEDDGRGHCCRRGQDEEEGVKVNALRYAAPEILLLPHYDSYDLYDSL